MKTDMETQSAAFLDRVDAAVSRARTAVSYDDTQATTTSTAEDATAHEAFVELARAAYDALADWEVRAGQPLWTNETTPGRVTRWRGQLDDLRVQAALAEMEVRDSSQEVLAAAGRRVSAVEDTLAAAKREVGSALTSLRRELQRVS